MKSQVRFKLKLFVLLAALSAASLPLSDAVAQHYEGCFMNGQQVADSMCQSGGGGGGSAPSAMSSPAFGALSSMSYSLGAAIGTALRNGLQNTGPSSQGGNPEAFRAEQQRRLRIERENARLETERQQGAFRANQRTLVNEMRGLDHATTDLPAATATSELTPRQLDRPAEPSSPATPRPTTLRVVNQTDSYITVSVDGAYGCNTAGGTTCQIPIATGHHALRAVRTDSGAAFSQSVDVPDNGYVWALSGT